MTQTQILNTEKSAGHNGKFNKGTNKEKIKWAKKSASIGAMVLKSEILHIC